MRVLLPLPDRDFDVTEVAVPWAILRDAGHHVVFATEKAGTVPAADPRLLTGVLFGQLGAAAEARKLYYELIGTPEFGSTVAWADLDPAGFDGLILPGGHAPGMRQYLGSPVLSEQVGRFWRLNRPVGAICHGVLVLARTRDPDTGRSVLADRRTTCLPKYMERSAYLATAWRLGRYYRTYPAYVEDEVRAALDNPDGQFERGPVTLSARGSATDDGPAFVVPDRNYVSARWPGDAYLFGRTVRDLLESARSLYRTDRSIRPDDRHLAPRMRRTGDMTWEAHSFLCVSPDAVLTRHVQAIAGFSWGFTVSQHDITFARPAALGPEAWDSHLDLLRTDYRDWIFDSGYLPA